MTRTAGELERIGLEEVEPGCVEDTPHNRKRIRLQGSDWTWEQQVDEDGQPTGLIRVFNPSQVTARRTSVYERRQPILSDPENAWSDYVHPDEYPMDAEVPFWVLSRLARWRREARDGVPESERLPFPTRCEVIRQDETRCWNWASSPDRLPRCKAHAGWTKNSESRFSAYAKQRVIELTPDAVDALDYLLNHADGEAVRLKAATEILDRGGVKAGTDVDVHVEVEVTDPAIEVKRRLAQLAERASLPPATGEVVAGETVPQPASSVE